MSAASDNYAVLPIQIKSAKVTPQGTFIAFSKRPHLFWLCIPGSVCTSKTASLGRKYLFPAQYDVDAIIERLEALKRLRKDYEVDLRGYAFYTEKTRMYIRKAYKDQGTVSLKAEKRCLIYVDRLAFG